MIPRRPAAVHGVDSIPILSAEIAALQAEFNNMKEAAMHVQSITCELYGGGYDTSDCQIGNPFVKVLDIANYLGTFFKLQ